LGAEITSKPLLIPSEMKKLVTIPGTDIQVTVEKEYNTEEEKPYGIKISTTLENDNVEINPCLYHRTTSESSRDEYFEDEEFINSMLQVYKQETYDPSKKLLDSMED
jgi:hypothetical protein